MPSTVFGLVLFNYGAASVNLTRRQIVTGNIAIYIQGDNMLFIINEYKERSHYLYKKLGIILYW